MPTISPITPARVRRATRLVSVATTGLRQAQRQARSARPTGRAAIGSPCSQRPRSSASAAAECVPPGRVLLQALQADHLQVPVQRGPRLAAARGAGPAPAAASPAPSRPGTAAGRRAERTGSSPGRTRRSRGTAPRLPDGLLRGHVGGRARARRRVCVSSPVGRDPAGQPEVGHVRPPAPSSRMFDGFRSRCRMPRSCAWCTARATSATSRAAARSRPA